MLEYQMNHQIISGNSDTSKIIVGALTLFLISLWRALTLFLRLLVGALTLPWIIGGNPDTSSDHWWEL